MKQILVVARDKEDENALRTHAVAKITQVGINVVWNKPQMRAHFKKVNDGNEEMDLILHSGKLLSTEEIEEEFWVDLRDTEIRLVTPD
jgi:hypothetical protein